MSNWYEAVKDEDLVEFESPGEVELRVAPDILIFASKTGLGIRHKNGQVTGVGLRLWLDRSQLYRAVKNTGLFGLTPTQLLGFDPNLPIICDLDGNAAIFGYVQAGLDTGRPFEDLVTDTGKNGFPMFFDLKNYSLKHIYKDRDNK